MMRWLAAMLAALAFCGAARAQAVDTGHLTAELVSQTQGIAPGQTVYVALRQKIQDGWHTYWRNAGDSGEATTLAWTLPAGWKAGAFVWPTPRRLPVGPLVNYGYEGEVLLPVPVIAAADARPGQTAVLTAKASFLVCKEICVPEDARLQIALPVTAAPAPPDPTWAAPIAKALAAAPRSAALTAAFARRGQAVALGIVGGPLKGADVRDAYFYPYDSTVIDHAKPQGLDRGPAGLTLTLVPGYAFQGGAQPKALAGVLAIDGKAYELTAAPGPLPAGAGGLGPPLPKAALGGSLSLLPAALFAFLGGLILNLMPCVFPVLAMKAASLAAHGGREQAQARRHGLAFGAGVLAAFLALAAALIALKAAGAAVGWGFQLQSPPVVAVLALLMTAVALNLSGVFEVGTSLQGAGSSLAARGGLAGDVFTGVLAVVVAAPCTAPFMGAAVGWALTQPPAAALAVFLALGLGFAAPFVAVTFVPGLLARLPRPGPWMEVFRRVLAFPMYAAAAWLVWVLTIQAGEAALARILAAAIVLAFAAWLLGLEQRRQAVAADGRRGALGLLGVALVAVATVAVISPPYGQGAARAQAAPRADLAGSSYSPEKLAALRADGKPVFVNYTAAWCVSCQVNDLVVLSTRPVAQAMKRDGFTYLKADWTRRDPAIAAELARFGRAGVPLYLVYGAGGAQPVILPAILTQGVVIHALDAGAAKAG